MSWGSTAWTTRAGEQVWTCRDTIGGHATSGAASSGCGRAGAILEWRCRTIVALRDIPNSRAVRGDYLRAVCCYCWPSLRGLGLGDLASNWWRHFRCPASVSAHGGTLRLLRCESSDTTAIPALRTAARIAVRKMVGERRRVPLSLNRVSARRWLKNPVGHECRAPNRNGWIFDARFGYRD